MKGLHLQAFLLVELAGLEPATSWVRFRSGSFPLVAIVRRWRNHAEPHAHAFAAVRPYLSRRIDHALTTGGLTQGANR